MSNPLRSADKKSKRRSNDASEIPPVVSPRSSSKPASSNSSPATPPAIIAGPRTETANALDQLTPPSPYPPQATAPTTVGVPQSPRPLPKLPDSVPSRPAPLKPGSMVLSTAATTITTASPTTTTTTTMASTDTTVRRDPKDTIVVWQTYLDNARVQHAHQSISTSTFLAKELDGLDARRASGKAMQARAQQDIGRRSMVEAFMDEFGISELAQLELPSRDKATLIKLISDLVSLAKLTTPLTRHGLLSQAKTSLGPLFNVLTSDTPPNIAFVRLMSDLKLSLLDD